MDSVITSVQPHRYIQLNIYSRNLFHGWCTNKTLFLAAYMSLKFQPQLLVNSRDRTNNSGFNNLTKTLVPQIYLWRQPSSNILSEISQDHDYIQSTSKDVYCDHKVDFSCIDFLVQLLHESATLISAELKNNEISKNYPKLAKAWIGMDPDAWQGHISYQAAVYALLKAVLAIEEALDDKHVVDDILSHNMHLIFESLEYNMNKKGAKFVKWFAREQIPALTKSLTVVLESRASKYIKSYKAVTTLAITCCVAIGKINPARISCPSFTASLLDIKWKLVESSPDFSSLEIGHHKATKLGVEHEFLTYFGTKIFDKEARGNVLFWMGLLLEKLVAAFHREKVITLLQHFCRSKVAAEDLAIIGLFAFLGRKTRLFIEQTGIVDLDDPLNDFICYLECGIIFLYPELCSICAYQLFMDMVTEEIAWLDLYAMIPSANHQEKKRSKQHTIQAEKEMILSSVFGVCLDMFSSFALYIEKNEQSLNPSLQAYLHVSKCLLTFCLEDYWAAYDRLSDEVGRITEVQFPEPVMQNTKISKVTAFFSMKQNDLKTDVTTGHNEKFGGSDKILEMHPEAAETKPHQSFFAKSRSSILASISDMYMGTQLLFVDFKLAAWLVQKRIFGQVLTKRERKKIARTVIDFVCVIPIVILMLLPVTAIGHAAMLTAIKRYIPDLIPSPYSPQKLQVIKQLRKAKKMKVDSCNNPNAVSLAF